MGLAMASYGGLQGIRNGLTESTDHPIVKPKTTADYHGRFIHKFVLKTLI